MHSGSKAVLLEPLRYGREFSAHCLFGNHRAFVVYITRYSGLESSQGDATRAANFSGGCG